MATVAERLPRVRVIKSMFVGVWDTKNSILHAAIAALHWRLTANDGWSCLRVYRAGEVVWWRGRPWESRHAGNVARPEVVVEGNLYVAESWAPVWDDESDTEANSR